MQTPLSASLSSTTLRFSAIVAASPSGVIGKDGDMPWKLSTDLQRFKKLTMGAPIVMGRKTFESIGRPLPGRRNLVLSSQQNLTIAGVEVISSVDDLLHSTSDVSRAYVIGGATIYQLLLPYCDEILLTQVHTQVQGDTHVQVNLQGFRQTFTERIPQDNKNSVPTEFQIWRIPQ